MLVILSQTPTIMNFKPIREMVRIHPSSKFWVRTSNGSVVRSLIDEHTDTHTHTPTGLDVGGNDNKEQPC